MPRDKKIWGVPVAVSLAGRTNWPNEIKIVAVRKVLDDGERLADIGREIGAHENLIRKWVGPSTIQHGWPNYIGTDHQTWKQIFAYVVRSGC